MNPVEQILQKFPIMILDGAMATELEKYGCNLNDSLWSAKVLMENPELIKQVHTDYFKAGADCAITASYQATVEGYKQRGLSEFEAMELIKKSVQIATTARDEFWVSLDNQTNRPKPLVAASVGPYGAYLANGAEYQGNYLLSEDELVNFHKDRIQALIEAGADILACETIPCLVEAKAIVTVLKDFPGVYAWFSFSAKDGLHISDGDRVADCAKWLNEQEQVAAIGINCTSPIYISSLIKEIQAQTTKPVIVYPNSGEVYDPISKTWGTTSSEGNFSLNAQHWYESGAKLIGGCCKTTPSDIVGIVSWARK